MLGNTSNHKVADHNAADVPTADLAQRVGEVDEESNFGHTCGNRNRSCLVRDAGNGINNGTKFEHRLRTRRDCVRHRSPRHPRDQ